MSHVLPVQFSRLHSGWALGSWSCSKSASAFSSESLYAPLHLQEALEAVQAARCASQVGVHGEPAA
jgi:hypothetical protein